MTKPRPGLAGIAPPSREAPVIAATETPSSTGVKPLNVRIDAQVFTDLKVLAARTGISQQALVERALKLLFTTEGH